MFTRQDLVDLSSYRPTGQLVTTLCLTVDPASRPQKGYLTVFKNLAKSPPLPVGATREQKMAVEKDIGWMSEFLDSRPDFAPARGLALISASGDHYHRHYPLPLEVPDRLAVLDRPMVSPLILAASRYRPGLVVQASRGGGRLYSVYCGQIEEVSSIDSDVPADVREAGFSGYQESRIARRIEELVDKHLRTMAGMVRLQWEQGGNAWLVVSGTEELTGRLVDVLPDDLKGRVLGSLTLGMDAPATQVMEASMELEGRARMDWEKSSVDRLLAGLSSGEPVAVGLRDASSAMYRSAVKMLLVSYGSFHPGSVCSECRYLVIEGGRCPACQSNDLIEVRDAVDKLVERGLKAGSRVESVGRGLGLDDHDGVGAFLRF